MVYVLLSLEVPRDQVRKAWDLYLEKVQPWDEECVKKVGGKLIGSWYTEYGRNGEINILRAYNKLEDREEVLRLFWEGRDDEYRKWLAEWTNLTPNATMRVWRPLPGSPLD